MSSLIQHPIEQEFGYAMRSVRRPFNQKFPTVVGIIIGILQMFLNGAIVGLEGGSAAYNPKYDIIYAGFWCSFSFFFAWIFMFAFLFFRKTVRWGLVVAGINLVSIGFGIIIIVFDSLFIQNPGQCYLATVCASNSTIINNLTNTDGKLRVVKAQLACAAAMLTSNIIYIIIFIILFAITRVSYKPLNPSFKPMPSSHSSSPKVRTQLPIQTLTTYPTSHQLSYNSQYRQPIYHEQPGYWRTPSTPYMNRIEKF